MYTGTKAIFVPVFFLFTHRENERRIPMTEVSSVGAKSNTEVKQLDAEKLAELEAKAEAAATEKTAADLAKGLTGEIKDAGPRFESTKEDTIAKIKETLKAELGVSDEFLKKLENAEYFKKLENPAELKKRIKAIKANAAKAMKEKLDETVYKQGFIGKSWNWVKNKTGAGAGSEKTHELLNKLEKGEITLKEAEKGLMSFEQGQKMAVDMVATIGTIGAVTGVMAAGIVSAPFTAGTSLAGSIGASAALLGTGAVVKAGIKAADKASGGQEITLKDVAKDATMGAVDAGLTIATMGVAPVVMRGTGAVVGNALSKGAAQTVQYVATGATSGAMFSGTSAGTDYLLNAEDPNLVDFAKTTGKAAAAGAVFGGVAGAVGGNIAKGVDKAYIAASNAKSTIINNSITLGTIKAGGAIGGGAIAGGVGGGASAVAGYAMNTDDFTVDGAIEAATNGAQGGAFMGAAFGAINLATGAVKKTSGEEVGAPKLTREDALKALGLDPKGNYTDAQIKTAYRNMAKVHHPDAGGNADAFHAVNDAYLFMTKKAPLITGSEAKTSAAQPQNANNAVVKVDGAQSTAQIIPAVAPKATQTTPIARAAAATTAPVGVIKAGSPELANTSPTFMSSPSTVKAYRFNPNGTKAEILANNPGVFEKDGQYFVPNKWSPEQPFAINPEADPMIMIYGPGDSAVCKGSVFEKTYVNKAEFDATGAKSYLKPTEQTYGQVIEAVKQAPMKYVEAKTGTQVVTEEGTVTVKEGDVVAIDVEGNPYVMPKSKFVARSVAGDSIESKIAYDKMKYETTEKDALTEKMGFEVDFARADEAKSELHSLEEKFYQLDFNGRDTGWIEAQIKKAPEYSSKLVEIYKQSGTITQKDIETHFNSTLAEQTSASSKEDIGIAYKKALKNLRDYAADTQMANDIINAVNKYFKKNGKSEYIVSGKATPSNIAKHHVEKVLGFDIANDKVLEAMDTLDSNIDSSSIIKEASNVASELVKLYKANGNKITPEQYAKFCHKMDKEGKVQRGISYSTAVLAIKDFASDSKMGESIYKAADKYLHDKDFYEASIYHNSRFRAYADIIGQTLGLTPEKIYFDGETL